MKRHEHLPGDCPTCDGLGTVYESRDYQGAGGWEALPCDCPCHAENSEDTPEDTEEDNEHGDSFTPR